MHTSIYRALLILILLTSGSGLLVAQDNPTAEPDTATDEIEPGIFEMAFTDEETIYGVVPAEWDEIQPGAAIRIEETGDNLTYLLHLAIPGATIDEAIEPLLTPLGLDELPGSGGDYEGGYYTWTLYDVQYEPEQLEGETLSVIIATAEDEAGAYIIVLQSLPDEIDDLYLNVMRPALDTFGLSRDDITTYLELDDFIYVDIPEFGISVDVPTQWTNVNPGAYMRVADETDFTTLLIQTAEDIDEREFADLLRESVGVPFDLPENGEVYALDNFDWLVYELDFDAQETQVTLVIATASDETFTYLVALLALSEEADALRDNVLLPILESVASK